MFYNRQMFSCLGILYCEIQTTFLLRLINPLIIYVNMSYKRCIEPSRLAPPCSLADIDSVQLVSIDNEVKSSPLDLSQVDKIHVEDLSISVLQENGMLGNFKPYHSDPSMLLVNDSLRSANSFIKKASDFKESIVESQNLDNNESN